MLVALAICIFFIGRLFWIDLKRSDNPSNAVWIPFTWMFFAGSRALSAWLSLGPSFASASDYSEGSPVDAALYFSLIAAGIFVLSKRRVDWPALLASNALLVAYFLYCLVSVGWSDEPVVMLKRWAKDLGNPIMALILLTEARPYEAVGVVFRRLAFIFLPVSLLFIRYFPEFGRGYRPDGSPMFTGIGRQKNDLGLMCLMSGLYAAWDLLWGRADSMWRKHKGIGFVLLFIWAWLLRLADSQTSVVCLTVAVSLMALGRAPMMMGRPNLLFGTVFTVGGVLWLLEDTFSLKANLLAMLGRNPTLTNRTDVWDILRRFEVDPFIGAGFMSFWTGARMDEIWKLVGTTINQAHNGYLEQYLNLGYVGVAFIIAIAAKGLMSGRGQIAVDPRAGFLRVSFIICAILYNYTEASFYGVNNMWVMLLLGCIEVPRAAQSRLAPAPTIPQRKFGVKLNQTQSYARNIKRSKVFRGPPKRV